MKKCFLINCDAEGFFEYRNAPTAFKKHFKGKLACESHKLDGDIDVRSGLEYVEINTNAFRLKRSARIVKRLLAAK